MKGDRTPQELGWSLRTIASAPRDAWLVRGIERAVPRRNSSRLPHDPGRHEAVVSDSYGPPSLRLEDVPVPSPGAGQVLVRIATSVNLSDWMPRRTPAYARINRRRILGSTSPGGRGGRHRVDRSAWARRSTATTSTSRMDSPNSRWPGGGTQPQRRAHLRAGGRHPQPAACDLRNGGCRGRVARAHQRTGAADAFAIQLAKAAGARHRRRQRGQARIDAFTRRGCRGRLPGHGSDPARSV